MKTQKTLKLLGVLAALALVVACGGKKDEAPQPTPALGGEAAKPAEAKPDEARTDEARTDEARTDEVAASSGEAVALRGVASVIIRAFAAKDMARLAEFAPAEAREMIKEMQPGNAQFDTLFDESKWRFKAAKGWDGKAGPVRLDGDKAWVKFADLPDDEVAVVRLRKVDGKWLFDDFASPSKERWGSWGAEAK